MTAENAFMLALAHENDRLRSELSKMLTWAEDQLPVLIFHENFDNGICRFYFANHLTHFGLCCAGATTHVYGRIWDGDVMSELPRGAHQCTEIEFDGSRIAFRQDAEVLCIFDIRPDGYSFTSKWGEDDEYEHPLFHMLEFEKKLRAFCAIPGNPTRCRDVRNTQ